MYNFDEFVVAESSPEGVRFCTNCNQRKKSDNGYWKMIDRGTKRRWFCAGCMAARRAKHEKAIQ